MGHIHTNPGEHDHTVSAFIIRIDTHEPQLLLHKHKILKVLLQPGGHIELTENPWQAVCREIAEETGYKLSQLKILQPRTRIKTLDSATLHPVPMCINTHNFDDEGTHRHTDQGYAFEARGGPFGEPDEGESTEMRWVSLSELTALTAKDIYPNVQQLGIFLMNTVLSEWEAVDLDSFSA